MKVSDFLLNDLEETHEKEQGPNEFYMCVYCNSNCAFPIN